MYDSNAGDISSALTSVSTEVFTADTIDRILSLVTTTGDTIKADQVVVPADGGTLTFAADTGIAFVTGSDTEQSTFTVVGNTPVVLFQGNGGVDATFGTANTPAGGKDIAHADETAAADAIVRVVVGTAGADKITIADGKNTQVVLGDKDEVHAGSGHDLIVAAQGSSKVIGTEHTVVQAVGTEASFTVTAEDGHAVITNGTTGVTVDITGAQFVDLDGDDALIFAANEKQAAVANLYHAVFGRNADASGIDYWFDLADAGTSVKEIATAFLNTNEFKGGTLSDADFVDSLYANVLGRDADTDGAKFWVDSLSHGATRADVVTAFAEVAAVHDTNVEASIVGVVVVVDGIA